MESEDMASLNFDRAENYNSIQMKSIQLTICWQDGSMQNLVNLLLQAFADAVYWTYIRYYVMLIQTKLANGL